MNFHVGDTVVHWTHGLGRITALEERALTGENKLYYIVQIQDLTVCVPADDKSTERLRFPTTEGEFKKLFQILRGPGETLSEDRHERKKELHRKLADGKAETVCRVIRDLHYLEQGKSLNDDDRNIMKRARNCLLGEWGFSLSLPPARVEADLQRLLAQAA